MATSRVSATESISETSKTVICIDSDESEPEVLLSSDCSTKKKRKLQQREKLVLSFDVGWKNLSFCLARITPGFSFDWTQAPGTGRTASGFKIEAWQSIAIPGVEASGVRYKQPTAHVAVASLVSFLKGQQWSEVCGKLVPDVVVIEVQMRSNFVANALAYSLQTYFLCKGIQVTMCPAQSKFDFLPKSAPLRVNKQSGQKKNKKHAIAVAEQLVKFIPRCAAMDSLSAAKKKDDLADCFLQVLWYIDKDI